MKKVGGSKLLFVFLLVGLLLFSSSFVVAQATGPTGATGPTATSEAPGIIKTLWDTFLGGLFDGAGSFSFIKYQAEISKVLLILLVVILVYSVTDVLPFFPEDKDGIKWIFSGIIGLLAFLFVSKETIGGITDTYGALGVALTSVIPLVILVAFAWKIRSRYPVAASFLNPFMFLIFGLWMLLTWRGRTGQPYITAYLASAFLALIWVIVGNRVLSRFSRMYTRREHEEELATVMNDQVFLRLRARIDDLRTAHASITGAAARAKSQKRIDILEAEYKQQIKDLSS